VAAEHHDPCPSTMIVLLWQGGLEAEYLFREIQRDQHVETFLFHHVAADDADLEPFVDLVFQGGDQELEPR